MLKNMIITLMSDDKPGVVESVASAISDQGGNWLESQLAQLGGKFAGVVRIQIAEGKLPALKDALSHLTSKQIRVHLDECNETGAAAPESKVLSFQATGPDRPGIVREISSAIAHYQINLEKLDTQLSSMPYSGEPLFEAKGTIAVPLDLDQDELEDRLDNIANMLAVDISLNE